MARRRVSISSASRKRWTGEPADGFGAATVQLAQYFRMAPVSQSGQPTEGAMVRLPMVWKLN
jgi:hypothetical protein